MMMMMTDDVTSGHFGRSFEMLAEHGFRLRMLEDRHTDAATFEAPRKVCTRGTAHMRARERAW